MKLQFTKIVLVLSLLTIITTTTQALNNHTKNALRVIDKIFMTVPDKNIIISPASLKTTLALIYMGAFANANNPLSDDMLQDKARVLSEAHKLKFRTRDFATSTFTMKNHVFVSNKYEIRPSFEATTQYFFDATPQKVDFSDSKKAVQTINSWIKSGTNNKMINALTPNDVYNETVAMLVNAIYFKGRWLCPFDTKATTKRDFYLSKTKTKKVDMMSSYDLYPYAELPELDAKAILLSYKGSDIKMFLVLPNEIPEGYTQEIPGNFSSAQTSMTDFTKKLVKKYVHLTLPKFKFEFSMTLKKTSGGIMNIFKSIKLDRMFVDGRNLFISEVIHSAFIEVNEKGTVADGATAPIAKKNMPRGVVNEFNANRPFFFAILDETDVFFVGQVNSF